MHEIAELLRAYTLRKRELNALDLDDLLLYWHAAVSDDRLGRRLAAHYDHVLVDEYQDVNAIQVEIVHALCREHENVTVVGDDMQAIYGFRAADPEHILAFPSRYPRAAVITLERNYRSPQTLLDAGNEVAAHAARSFPRHLVAEREGGGRPELVFCLDEQRQASEVCERVLARREEGALLRGQAVLMRAGYHSDLLELELSRAARSPSASTAGSATWKPRMSRTSSRCSASPPTRVIRSPGFAFCNCSRGSDPCSPGGSSTSCSRPTAPGRRLATRCRGGARGAGASASRPCSPLLRAAPGPRADGPRNVLAPLIHDPYADGEVRLVDLEQLVGAAAGGEP